ncbi:uncharacterized protein LOC119551786 [Drosophila subpulchrella]|uniref:uncharacterized protein LOC119551786 n=1 Tax=Drosophila subpulchrella TaxID=1486046 RepID=UPI0018A185BD|nr:uncharacterized protein LOC119551786 [Drosophila subpulchrella]
MQSHIASVLLLAWFLGRLGSSQFLEEPCGNIILPKVVNGENATLQHSAWMAAVYNSSNVFLCGGTLIHKRFVLTAGHCIYRQVRLYVRLGAYNKSDPRVQKNVVTAISHRLFHGYPEEGNDIGLLKLDSSVVYDYGIHPICIVVDKNVRFEVDRMAAFRALGWGLTKPNGQDSDILQTISVNNLHREMCERVLGVNVFSKQLCAGSVSGDTCSGDSGGPLINTYRYREAQFGIVSFGQPGCNGIGVYTDVTSYADWIEATIKKYDTPDTSTEIPLQPQDKWLYGDCGGNSIASNLQADIYGPNFVALGVMITDQFVLTNAWEWPVNVYSLQVGVRGTHEAYRVTGIFKNPVFFKAINGIALLKLDRRVTGPDGVKPICMLANLRDQQAAIYTQPFIVFDYVPAYGGHRIYQFNVDVVHPHDCRIRIQRQIGDNQFCVETPRGISASYGYPGDILGISIMHFGKERFVLLGIVSYSINGINVFTNVMGQTEWFANITKSY